MDQIHHAHVHHDRHVRGRHDHPLFYHDRHGRDHLPFYRDHHVHGRHDRLLFYRGHHDRHARDRHDHVHQKYFFL